MDKSNIYWEFKQETIKKNRELKANKYWNWKQVSMNTNSNHRNYWKNYFNKKEQIIINYF